LASGETDCLSRDYGAILRKLAFDRARNDVICDMVAHMAAMGRNVLVFSLRAGVHLPILCEGILDRLRKWGVGKTLPRRSVGVPPQDIWTKAQKNLYKKTSEEPPEQLAPLVGCMFGAIGKSKTESED